MVFIVSRFSDVDTCVCVTDFILALPPAWSLWLIRRRLQCAYTTVLRVLASVWTLQALIGSSALAAL